MQLLTDLMCSLGIIVLLAAAGWLLVWFYKEDGPYE